MLISGTSRLVNVYEDKHKNEVPVRGALRLDWREKEGEREGEEEKKKLYTCWTGTRPASLGVGMVAHWDQAAPQSGGGMTTRRCCSALIWWGSCRFAWL
jgi:hypothetical protein